MDYARAARTGIILRQRVAFFDEAHRIAQRVLLLLPVDFIHIA
jgi:hypothetical protein